MVSPQAERLNSNEAEKCIQKALIFKNDLCFFSCNVDQHEIEKKKKGQTLPLATFGEEHYFGITSNSINGPQYLKFYTESKNCY